MFGKATLDVPATSEGDAIRVQGLSDQVAISYGKLFARTLSEQDGFVTVVLESGVTRIIGHDTINETLVMGCVHSTDRYLHGIGQLTIEPQTEGY
jgi:hypothetical protein